MKLTEQFAFSSMLNAYVFQILEVSNLLRHPPSTHIVAKKLLFNEISCFRTNGGETGRSAPTLGPPYHNSMPNFVQNHHHENH
jgi:hypothetical protein